MKSKTYSVFDRIIYYGKQLIFKYICIHILLKLILHTKPIKSYNYSDIEIHTILCKKHLLLYLFSIKSFLYSIDYNCKIIVHDDGTLDKRGVNLLKKHITSINIIKRSSANQIINNALVHYPDLLNLRSKLLMSKKIFDFDIISNKNSIKIHLDSDILFFRKEKIIHNYLCNKPKYILYTREPNYWVVEKKINSNFVKFYDINSNLMKLKVKKVITSFNAGLLIYSGKIVDYNKLNLFYDLVKDYNKLNWIEQSYYALLCSTLPAKPLPKIYVNKYKYNINNPISRHHFGEHKFNNWKVMKDIIKCYWWIKYEN